MKKILISPFSNKLSETNTNAKNYPYWKGLIKLLRREYEIYQVGVSKEEKLKNVKGYYFDYSFEQLEPILKESSFFISVDNFFPHFAHYVNKHGFVIFGKSDPELFGYKENINIYKSKECFRKYQYLYWVNEPYDKNVFVHPETIYKIIKKNEKRFLDDKF